MANRDHRPGGDVVQEPFLLVYRFRDETPTCSLVASYLYQRLRFTKGWLLIDRRQVASALKLGHDDVRAAFTHLVKTGQILCRKGLVMRKSLCYRKVRGYILRVPRSLLGQLTPTELLIVGKIRAREWLIRMGKCVAKIPPSQRMMAEDLGLSESHVHHLFAKLQREGWILKKAIGRAISRKMTRLCLYFCIGVGSLAGRVDGRVAALAERVNLGTGIKYSMPSWRVSSPYDRPGRPSATRPDSDPDSGTGAFEMSNSSRNTHGRGPPGLRGRARRWSLHELLDWAPVSDEPYKPPETKPEPPISDEEWHRRVKSLQDRADRMRLYPK